MMKKVFGISTLLLVFMSCIAPTKPMYELPSISNYMNAEETKTPYVYVQLLRDSTNIIAIFNHDTYEQFRIDRQASVADSMKPHLWINLTPLDKYNVQRLVTVVPDTLQSQLTNRYEVHPIVNQQILEALPIDYVTDDSSYHYLIEEK